MAEQLSLLDYQISEDGTLQLEPKKPKSRKKTKEELELEKSAEKHKYIERKQLVMSQEEENYRDVIIFRSTGDWWKIAEKSALYYSKLIFPLIRSRRQNNPNIHADTDNGDISKIGIISIPDIDSLIKKAETAGFKVKKQNDDIYRIKLHDKITQEQFHVLYKADAERRDLAARMVAVDGVWPAVKTKAINQLTLIRAMTRDLDTSLQRTIGDPIMSGLVNIVQLVQKGARGTIPRTEALAEMSELVDDIDGALLCGIYMQIFHQDRQINFSSGMAELKRAIETAIKENSRKTKQETATNQ